MERGYHTPTRGEDKGDEFTKVPTRVEQELAKPDVSEANFMRYVLQFNPLEEESKNPAPDDIRCCAMVLDPTTHILRQCKNRGESRQLNLDGGSTEDKAYCKPHNKIYGLAVRTYKNACDSVIGMDPIQQRMVITVQIVPRDTESSLIKKLRKLRTCYKLRRAHEIAFFYGSRCILDRNHIYPLELLMNRIDEFNEKLNQLKPKSPQKIVMQSDVTAFGFMMSDIQNMISTGKSTSPTRSQSNLDESSVIAPSPKSESKTKKKKKKKNRNKGQTEKVDKRKEEEEEDALLMDAIAQNKPFANMIKRIRDMDIVKTFMRFIFDTSLEGMMEVVNAFYGRGDIKASTALRGFVENIEAKIGLDISLSKKEGHKLNGETVEEQKRDFHAHLMKTYDTEMLTKLISEKMAEMLAVADNGETFSKYEKTIADRVKNEKEKNVGYIVDMFHDMSRFYFASDMMTSIIKSGAAVWEFLESLVDQLVYHIIPYLLFEDFYHFESIENTIMSYRDVETWADGIKKVQQVNDLLNPRLVSIGMMYHSNTKGKMMLDDGNIINIGNIIESMEEIKDLRKLITLAGDIGRMVSNFGSYQSKVNSVLNAHTLISDFGLKMITFADPDLTRLLWEVYEDDYEEITQDVLSLSQECQEKLRAPLNSLCLMLRDFNIKVLFEFLGFDNQTHNVRNILIREFILLSAAIIRITPAQLLQMVFKTVKYDDVDTFPYHTIKNTDLYLILAPCFLDIAGFFLYQFIINEIAEPELNRRYLRQLELHKNEAEKLNKAVKSGKNVNLSGLSIYNLYEYRRVINIFELRVEMAHEILPLYLLPIRLEEKIKKIIPIANRSYTHNRIVTRDNPTLLGKK